MHPKDTGVRMILLNSFGLSLWSGIRETYTTSCEHLVVEVLHKHQKCAYEDVCVCKKVVTGLVPHQYLKGA
jgi:hypothetical protein